MTQTQDIMERIEADQPNLSRAFRQIAGFLAQNPQDFIRQPIRELSGGIGVSEPTLIRFSRRYGYKGMPDLRLAIAMSLAASNSADSAHVEPAISDKEVVNRGAKRAIAGLAATLIRDDSSVLLDSGSTVQFLTSHIREAHPLTVMTTGLNLLLKLRDCTQHELILPGGIVRHNAMSLSGRLVEDSLAGMSFDTVYLGADSIDPKFGLSTFSNDEAHLNRAMIKACRRVVVLADASKFKSPALHRICGLRDVDVIVSDDEMPPGIRQAIAAEGPQLMLATALPDPEPA